MANLFTNAYIIKSAMRDARRLKSNTEKVAIKIQKEIDYAAEHGRGEVIVYTGDFYLTASDVAAIDLSLNDAGYKHSWRDRNNKDERIHVLWEEENV